MKSFLSTLFLIVIVPIAVFAYTSPGKSQGFVSDFVGIISAMDISVIESQLKNLKDTTGIEIAVATVPSLGNEVIETYAVKLFEEWGIGIKGKDNGLLILIAPNDRQARIEIGYGLEGTITDIQTKNIVDQVMLPAFRVGNYSLGIKDAVGAVIVILNKSPEANQYTEASNISRSTESSNPRIDSEAVFIFGFFFLGTIINILSRTKSWWFGGAIGALIGVVVGLIWGFLYYGLGAIFLLTVIGLIIDYFASKHGPHSGIGLWFGGRHGGGSFGSHGSFGGFGGGMSGGGGASGRW